MRIDSDVATGFSLFAGGKIGVELMADMRLSHTARINGLWDRARSLGVDFRSHVRDVYNVREWDLLQPHQLTEISDFLDRVEVDLTGNRTDGTASKGNSKRDRH